jgi:hypothetical protein
MWRRRSALVLGAVAGVVLSGFAGQMQASAEVQEFSSAAVVPPGDGIPHSVTPDRVRLGTVVGDTDRVAESASITIDLLNLAGRAERQHCLDAEMRKITRDGGVVQVKRCIAGPIFGSQDWRFEPTEVSGLYRIRIGGERCLDADNRFGLRNGDKIQIFQCRGGAQTNQHWWLVESRLGGPFQLVSNANGRCMSIKLLGDNPAHWLDDYSPAVLLDCTQRIGQDLRVVVRLR